MRSPLFAGVRFTLLLIALTMMAAGCTCRRTGSGENSLILCSDGLDNDGDGLADCNDADCATYCASCGNGICEAGEDSVTCPIDCTGSCGNGVCEAGEDPTNCSADCYCGDGFCDPPEDATTCPADCTGGSCGNGICEVGEDPTNCSADCYCGDGFCDPPEDAVTCPADCGGGGGFSCFDYCTLQDGCGYFPGVWPDFAACMAECDTVNDATCLSCFEANGGADCNLDCMCGAGGCGDVCGTNSYCPC